VTTILVLDLEYNQPSGKIIQLAIVELCLTTLDIKTRYNTFVDPKEPLDDYITNLTGIAQNDVDRAPTLKEALHQLNHMFQDLSPSPIILCGWGDDASKLLRDWSSIGQEPPAVKTFDLVCLWKLSRLWAGNTNPRTPSLLNMLAYYELEFEGQHHNALCDAIMTARLLREMSLEITHALGAACALRSNHA